MVLGFEAAGFVSVWEEEMHFHCRPSPQFPGSLLTSTNVSVKATHVENGLKVLLPARRNPLMFAVPLTVATFRSSEA